MNASKPNKEESEKSLRKYLSGIEVRKEIISEQSVCKFCRLGVFAGLVPQCNCTDRCDPESSPLLWRESVKRFPLGFSSTAVEGQGLLYVTLLH